MWIILAYVFAFVAVVLLVQTAAGIMFTSGDRTRRVNRRLDLLQSGMSRDDVFEALVRRKPKNAMSEAAPGLYERVSRYFRQAGVSVTPQRFVFVVAGIVLVLMALALVFLTVAQKGGGLLTNLVVSVVGAVGLGAMGAAVWLGWRRARRLRRLEEQLPVALDVTIRALRAGHPLIMSVKLAAEEMADPIGSEFGLIVDETNYGMEFRDALTSFAHRTGSEYAHFFAVCVSIQNETGGNLAEILQNLAAVIRAMQTLHLRVKALAAEGKMSAQVLTILPIGMVCFLLLTHPTFYTTKFDDPLFWPVAALTFVWFLIGQFMINRLVNFKY